MSEWLQFKGEVFVNHTDHYDLIATDGSEGIIRVEKSNCKIDGIQIYIKLGAEVNCLQPPKAHPLTKYLGGNNEIKNLFR